MSFLNISQVNEGLGKKCAKQPQGAHGWALPCRSLVEDGDKMHQEMLGDSVKSLSCPGRWQRLREKQQQTVRIWTWVQMHCEFWVVLDLGAWLWPISNLICLARVFSVLPRKEGGFNWLPYSCLGFVPVQPLESGCVKAHVCVCQCPGLMFLWEVCWGQWHPRVGGQDTDGEERPCSQLWFNDTQKCH